MPWRDRTRRRKQADEWRRENERRRRDREPAADDSSSETSPAAGSTDGGATSSRPPSTTRPDRSRTRPSVPVQLGEVDDAEQARSVRRVVSRALAEDLGPLGDVTSAATVPIGARGHAALVAREAGVVAGLDVVGEVVRQVDGRIEVELLREDGDRVSAGDVVARFDGPLRTLLTAERTMLNLVCQLSGVATTTAAYVAAVGGSDCAVRDTRKTTPGLRLLEKRAVRAGGGANHRVGLHDAILVKDNHVAAAGGVAAASRAALDGAPDGVHVQVEVTSLAEAQEAIAEGVVDLLLDNFTPDGLAAAIAAIDGRAAVEASGGITLGTAADFAAAGADRIAVGALTHSAPALDLALDVEQTVDDPSVTEVVTDAPADDAASAPDDDTGGGASGDRAGAAPVGTTAGPRGEGSEGSRGTSDRTAADDVARGSLTAVLGVEDDDAEIEVDRAPFDDGPRVGDEDHVADGPDGPGDRSQDQGTGPDERG